MIENIDTPPENQISLEPRLLELVLFYFSTYFSLGGRFPRFAVNCLWSNYDFQKRLKTHTQTNGMNGESNMEAYTLPTMCKIDSQWEPAV